MFNAHTYKHERVDGSKKTARTLFEMIRVGISQEQETNVFRLSVAGTSTGCPTSQWLHVQWFGFLTQRTQVCCGAKSKFVGCFALLYKS